MATSALRPGSLVASLPANESPNGRGDSRMRQSRILGSLFLTGFVVYGGGLSLVTSLVAGPDFLGALAPFRTLLVLGAFLMMLNTAVDIAKAVLFFPILERHSQRAALTYFAAIIVQVVFLSIGALAILMLVPLSQIAADPGATTLGTILVAAVSRGNGAYAWAMTAVAVAGVIGLFAALRLPSRLRPQAGLQE